jgi:hypothetical protein
VRGSAMTTARGNRLAGGAALLAGAVLGAGNGGGASARPPHAPAPRNVSSRMTRVVSQFVFGIGKSPASRG